MNVSIDGTERCAWPGTTFAEALDAHEEVRLTVWLRPKAGGELDVKDALSTSALPPGRRTYVERTALRRATDADPHDVQALRDYCESAGLTWVEKHWRSIVISGTLDRVVKAFGANAAVYKDANGKRFRQRTGVLKAPAHIASIVRGVFGLQQWPRSRRIGALQRHVTPLRVKQIESRYAFPAGDGSGETVAILQFRGEFKQPDFEQCMRAQTVEAALPILKRVDDAAIQHERQTMKDLEAAMDAQIVGALAPRARTVIYEAPDDERGFLDAIRTAIFDQEYTPSIVSISYGWPEFLWTPVALQLLDELFTAAALAGISVFCSSGDNGAELDYDGKAHVLAPASSRFAIACGGTALVDQAHTVHEVAWEHSGGGYSSVFAKPAWQAGKHGRGVPDVAAQQQPGFCVYLDGVELAMGGTSAIAPLFAALASRINQRLGVPIGFVAPLLYRSEAAAFRDVTEGSNGSFSAAAGWDPCTGLGVPIGTSIEASLR